MSYLSKLFNFLSACRSVSPHLTILTKLFKFIAALLNNVRKADGLVLSRTFSLNLGSLHYIIVWILDSPYSHLVLR
jgi:hypothetical protein